MQRLPAKGRREAAPLHRHDIMAVEGLGIGGSADFDQRRHHVDQMAGRAHEAAVQLRVDPLGPISDQRRRDAAFLGIMFEILERRRSEEHTSELQSLMRTSYAVFCLKKKKHQTNY